MMALVGNFASKMTKDSGSSSTRKRFERNSKDQNHLFNIASQSAALNEEADLFSSIKEIEEK